MDLLHLHWSRLPLADRRADGSAGRFCSMLSLSQADRLVLGSDLNRPESSWGAAGPSPASGPMSASSPLAGAAGLRGQCDARHASDSDRAGALHWSRAVCESRTRSTAANEVDGPMTSLKV